MKFIRFLIPLTLSLFIFGYCHGEEDIDIRLAQTASGRGREYVTELSDGWKFGGKDEDAYQADYDDSEWETVSLPHTWNVLDGADGGNNYLRTAYWYRKSLKLDTAFEGKRIYLEFLGANQQTDLYVNGTHAKLSGSDLFTHRGGYTAFRYDMTDCLKIGGNTIAVRVDNTKTETTAPISGDFNIYGGIYRRVYMIVVDDVHVDLSDHGSSGLFLTTPNIRSLEKPDDFGTLNIRASLVNDGAADRKVTVTAHIDGDYAPEDIIRQCTIPACGSVLFNEDAYIAEPHLWKGITYTEDSDHADVGYRYTVTLTVSDGDQVIDTVSDKIGFRYFYVDKEKGFYLNGELYPLRGVNRHQYKEGLGSALTEADHRQDLELIMEMGANTIRLCHYPQADYVYELCDENGIILWTEIPLVNSIGKEKSIKETTEAQLQELIRQQYNRPSVCFWGLENEIDDRSRNPYYTVKELLSSLDDLVHEEDRSGRYSTQAIKTSAAMDQKNPDNLADDSAERGWKSDLIGWNIYPGWYSDGTLDSTFSRRLKQDSRPIALSEYGWGASTVQHELYPELRKNDLSSGSHWHPEEYQNIMHEQAIDYINEHQNLWAAYVWCMFDFDVDSRDEGSCVAQNDKGLVTNDRKTKKDSFYLYKANWNRREPFVHITSSRYTGRSNEDTYVKVYSNCDSVQLYINGSFIGDMASAGNGVFITEGQKLAIGENMIRVLGRFGEEQCEDSCVWRHYTSSPSSQLVFDSSDGISVSHAAHTVTLFREMTIGELRSVLGVADPAACRIMQERAGITDEDTIIQPDMKIIVTDENEIYAHYDINLLYIHVELPSGVTVYATSNEEGNTPDKALDHDSDTCWAAENNHYPQTILLDLGDVRVLDKLEIDWSTKKNRVYHYFVEISEDGQDYELAADKQENEEQGTTVDSLNGAMGRYVKITVLSCSVKAGYAVINEIRVDCK